MKRIAIFVAAALCISGAGADSLDEARALMDAGRYGEARVMLDNLLSSAKASSAGQLNYLAGECALQLQTPDVALAYFNKAAQRGVADACLELGRLAMENYDFDTAREQYVRYVSLREKAGKDTGAGALGIARADLAGDMLDRVEKLVVVDCITTSRDKFLEAIALAPEAGSFAGDSSLPIFESADRRMRYSTVNTPEGPRIAEQTLLLDGTYDEPQTILDPAYDAAAPFMMPDGCTFYFASARPGGIGGLDIYRANRDSETGEFLGAVNMGMPYNSPADDLMLAIDEYTGAGWLVTNRGHEHDGMVSIYVFVPSEVRNNYDAGTEDIISLARIDNIEVTQDGEADYSALLDAIDGLSVPASAKKEATLSFTMPDGRVITSFRDPETREAVSLYLSAEQALARDEASLRERRSRYAASPTQSLAAEIIAAEQAIEELRRTTRLQKQKILERL